MLNPFYKQMDIINMNKIFVLFTGLSLLSVWACDSQNISKEKLPIIGNRDVVDGDSIYHTVRDFKFINQDSVIITPETFKDKAYVVDYFFTSCPTICPKVKQQEIKVADHFKDEERLKFLSVSIDTKYDTIQRLKWYAEKLEIDPNQWHLVTGDEDLIYDIAGDFFHSAIKNDDAPGGYDHDGLLILVDKNRHIRAFCNGLEPEEVDEFILDVEQLLAQEY